MSSSAANTAATILKARIFGAIGQPSPFRTNAAGQLHIPGSAMELTKADADAFLTSAEEARCTAIVKASRLFNGLVSPEMQELYGELYVHSNHKDLKSFFDSASTMSDNWAKRTIARNRARPPLVELKEAFVCDCKACTS